MEANNKYKTNADIIIKSYEDDLYYKDYFNSNVLSKHIKDSDSLQQLQVVTLPFVRFITDSISTLYNQAVIRTINTEDEKIVELFKEVENAYNEIASNIDKYTFMSGMIALKSHYDDIDESFEYVIFPNNMLEYTPRADDYTKYEELEFEYLYDSNRITEVWSKSEYSRVLSNSKIHNEENPYGFIPFTIFRDKKIPNSFYVAPKSSLLDMQDFITNQITQIGNNFKYQSMSMLVVKGGGDIKQINYGANAINKVSAEDDISFISPDSDLSQLLEVLNEEIKTFSRINGIPDSLISAAATSSGISLIISQKALDDYLKNRSKIFMNSELKAIKQGLSVLAYHRGINLPEDLEVSINHVAANPINKLTSEEMDLWDFFINKNIKTNIDLLKSLNPTLSNDEAEELLLKNKEINNNFGNTNIIENTNNVEEDNNEDNNN